MRVQSFVSIAVAATFPIMALAQEPATQAFNAAMEKMMSDMQMEPSGDADKDFAMMMIPHHQGAIDMARVELEHGDDPEIRAMAEKVIEAQEQEIAELQQWLESHP